ncbi:hypothetical protein CC2G_011897 [Coprinopsis cinerea AmutBmut pab1-1]|nr:hypothetical protein CC2G_011897 [Coprinopsis cinerea AmutBmut pab1-1]
MERIQIKGRDEAWPPVSSSRDLDIDEDVEDILSDSLGSMFGLQPVNVGSPGSPFTYHYTGIQGSSNYPPTTITLRTPDTQAANWNLHASSIWVSALYLADHIDRLDLPAHPYFTADPTVSPLRILELGASAGLPGILTAKLFPSVSVTVSDYPDDQLIKALSGNVALNDVERNCRTIPHGWGSDVSELLDGGLGFDVILAADTLWNSEFHPLLVDSIAKALRPCPHARVHLVSGLHTGRYAIQSFLRRVQSAGLAVDSMAEYEAKGTTEREWDVEREGEDDGERRRWVVWTVLKWSSLNWSHDQGEQLQLCCRKSAR